MSRRPRADSDDSLGDTWAGAQGDILDDSASADPSKHRAVPIPKQVDASSSTMKKRRRIGSSGGSSKSKSRSISPIKLGQSEDTLPPPPPSRPRDSSDIPLGSPSPSLVVSDQDIMEDPRDPAEDGDMGLHATQAPDRSAAAPGLSSTLPQDPILPLGDGGEGSLVEATGHAGVVHAKVVRPDSEMLAEKASGPAEDPARKKHYQVQLDDPGLLLMPPTTAQTNAHLATSTADDLTSHVNVQLADLQSEVVESGGGAAEGKQDPSVDVLENLTAPANIDDANVDRVSRSSEAPNPLITPLSMAPPEALDDASREEGEEELDPDRDIDPTPLTSEKPSAAESRSVSPSRAKPKPKAKAFQSKKPAAKLLKDTAKPKARKAAKGTTKKVPAKKEKTKVESIKESAKRAGFSSSPAPESLVTSEATTPGHPADSVDSEDDGVYCICRKPYKDEDEDVVMVACDGCDDWFHPGCVKIDEAKLDLLDSYICAKCEKTTTLRTRYKRVCKRERCDKSLTGNGKYCSSACAFRHMAEQVPPTTNKKLLKQLSTVFVGLPAPKSHVSVVHHLDTPPPTLAMSDHSLAAVLSSQIAAIKRALSILSKRQEILRQAIARCETLVLPALPEVESGDRKNKKRSGGGDDRPCGWDRRLMWTDEEVEEWTPDQDDDMNGDACLWPKRRCDRHQGWQKITTASLDLETAQLGRRKGDLEGQIRLSESQLGHVRAAQKAEVEFNEHIQRLKPGIL